MKERKTTDSSEMFDRIVRNALAFMERSVDELKDAPNQVCLICFAVYENTWNCTSCGRRVAGEFSAPLCFECDP